MTTYRCFALLLVSILLCTCGRDPLSVESVRVDAPETDDGLEAMSPGGELMIDADTTLLATHGDVTLRFSYQYEEGTAALLSLQDCYELDLGSLTLDGQQPKVPAKVMPGVWHDLEVVYVAAQGQDAAVVPELYLDGNLMHYQMLLPTCDQVGGTALKLASGRMRVAELRSASVAGSGSTVTSGGEVALNVPLLKYVTYALPAQTKDFDDWGREPTSVGYINRLHMDAVKPNGAPSYAVSFTGPLNIPKAGAYEFRTWGPSSARLYIDEELVVNHRGDPHWEHTGVTELSEGDHDFRLEYIFRGGWGKFDLGYTFTGQDERFLNTMEEGKLIAAPGSAEPVPIAMDDHPYILRSFAYFPSPKVYAEAGKRTHVASVGEGNGPHYSVDLQTGALLQVWRGGFADVQEMWIGRGESQVMRPLGTALSFDGKAQWSNDAQATWPDAPEEPDEDDFQHSSYRLDAEGRPLFTYRYGDATVTDKLVPDGDDLVRELTYTNPGSEEGYTMVAAASEITETAPGQFTLRSPGLRIDIESYDGAGLTLQSGGGKDRLIAQMQPAGHLRYRMNW